MQYHGGKALLAKDFAPILRADLDRLGGFFYEPFTGGFNVVPALGDSVKWALCGDLHPGLISLYSALRDRTWEPPEDLSEADYEWLKLDRDWSNPITAFAAFGCSFGAFEFSTFARDHKRGRSYAATARRSLLKKQRAMGSHVEFRRQDFAEGALDCDLAHGHAVIYADPPYLGTAGYLGKPFDHERFYRWCGTMAEAGHAVYIAEFSEPGSILDFEVAWEKMRFRGVRSNAGTHVRDVMFRVRGFARW